MRKQGETWVQQMKRELADVEIVPLAELRKLPAAEEFDAGVYFLWLENELQYVGKSNHICERLTFQDWANAAVDRTHPMKKIPYDRHTCIVLESGRLREDPNLGNMMQRLERAYIAHYQPPFNFLGQNPGT
jgi:hypothetical protein